ncbi:MAG: FtsX-like permease family protein [Bacteroidota bacterium]
MRKKIILSLLALGLAMVFLEYLIQGFYTLDPFMRKEFFLERVPWLYGVFFAFAVGVGILAGWLPARFLSRYQPVDGLKKLKAVKKFSYQRLRKALIVTQFVVCFAFTFTTLAVLQQKEHLLAVDLGLRTEQVLNVNLQGEPFFRFEQAVRQVKGVKSIGGSNLTPLKGTTMSGMMRRPGQDPVKLDYNYIRGEYLQTLGLTLLAGSQEPEVFPTGNQVKPIWLNQKAIAAFDFQTPEAALGQTLWMPDTDLDSGQVATQYLVTGVVKDFQYRSLSQVRSSINPTVLVLSESVSFANLLLDGQDVAGTLEGLRIAWEGLNSSKPIEYRFFDEEVEAAFITFNLATKVLSLVGILAVIIASLGLMGLVIYAVEGRMKEIGIRKVLGASVRSLIWMLSREFLILLGVAAVVALPLTYLGNHQWLVAYAKRISLGLNVIGPTILIIGGLSMWVVLSQTFRAARVNPVDILQDE